MARQKKRKRPQEAEADDDHQQGDPVQAQDAARAAATQQVPAATASLPGDSRGLVPQPQRQSLQTQEDAAELVALHRARFVPWQPAAIVAMAVTPDGSALAVGQESGSIELWETATWTCFQRIPGSEEASLSALAWVMDPISGQPRLFAGGLDGSLVEWDGATGRSLSSGDSYGGAVWALAPEPASAVQPGAAPRVAVACDDGVARLFTAEPGQPGLGYAKSLPSLGSRVLSVAWHPSGQSLLLGTAAGTLHAWALASGRELLRINVGDGSGREAPVWACLVLPDGTMVSGDGSGAVQLWDASLGTRLAAFRAHAADVLALAAAPDGGAVFAAGVDPQLVIIQCVPPQKGKPERWVLGEAKRPHTHDVRALAVANVGSGDPVLVSGGNDAQLLAHSAPRFAQEHPVRVCKCPQLPLLAHAPGAGEPVLVSAQGAQLDVWRLGVANSRSQQASSLSGWQWAEGSPVDVAREPCHLAHIAAKGPGHIAAVAVSARKQHVAYAQSGPDSTRLFRLAAAEGNYACSLERLALPEKLPAAAALALSADGGRLLLAAPQGQLLVIDTAKKEVVATFTEGQQGSRLEHSRPKAAAAALQPAARQVLVSPDGCRAALVAPGQAHIFDLQALAYVGRLPGFEDGAPVTAAAFGPGSDVIALASASNHLALFDPATLRHTPWSHANGRAPPPRLLRMPGSVSGISFCPDARAHAALLATPSALCHVDFGAPLPRQGRAKRRRARVKPPDDLGSAGSNFRVLPLENPCLLCAYTAPGAALLVEKAWTEVLKALPPPLFRHRYGT